MSDFPVDVLTVSETWFSPELDHVLTNLNGYTCHRCDRVSKACGGGLAICISDELHANYDHLKHQSYNKAMSNSEVQVLSIKVGNMKKIMLVNCYRPPSGSVPAFLKTCTISLII